MSNPQHHIATYLQNIFTENQWQTLENLVSSIMLEPELLETVTYGKGELATTNFSLRIYKFISRIHGVSTVISSYYTEKLLALINASPLASFNILRMQLNIMEQGSFVSRHIDAASDSAYKTSILIRLSTECIGGELVLYDDAANPHFFAQINRSILKMSANTPHEVTPVTAGKRYTICLFCGE